jgi:glyoxylate/hydroxypyruvate reductase A
LSAALPDVEIHYAGSAEEAAPHLSRTQILYGWGFSADLLRKLGAVRWVQKMGAGVDDIVGDWPFSGDVILTRTDGRLIAPRMVEYVVGAILDMSAGFDVARRLQRDRQWAFFEVGSIQDLTVGVAGLGDIGSGIAQTLKSLGARVVGWRRSSTPVRGVDELFAGDESLLDFVGSSDVIVLVLPLTRNTDRLFDANVFDRCRPGLHLINVGRGAVLDEQALLAAIDSGKVARATLDVFAVEPLPQDHPFWNHPKITVTPHVCGPLVPDKVVPHFLKNYEAFERRQPLRNVVDLARQY